MGKRVASAVHRRDWTSLFNRAVVRGSRAPAGLVIAVLVAMLVASWALAYTTGGTRSALPHLFYLPIILAALSFGLRGAMATALVATVVSGPAIPLDVATGEPQTDLGWLLRGAMFVLVGAVASLALVMRERAEAQQLSTEVRSAMTPMAPDDHAHGALLPLVDAVIDGGTFHPVFQPVYALAGGRLVAVEALTRFDVLPYRTPDLWFAAAARVGRGVELEIAAIAAAIVAAQDLPAEVSLSVNASPATLAHPGLLDLVRSCDGRQLTVEVTEHAVIEDYHLMKERLVEIRALGVQIAVDDAGAGIASLQHIVQLAPEIIKLDISLTQHAGSSPFRRAMAGALIEFAHRSGAQLIVEGIEDAADLTLWSALGADAVQGYLVGYPAALPALSSSPLIVAMAPLH
ncbi:MAG: EAL domain-containing protein [Cellulomonas sp.]|uniref:EAL domain-containing protein n=1 Tax=Cellulomonas sp. TaxID=40001 RepID=UPI0017A96DB7|nr:EAL domain-containing protein [Cellulomonas sp.]NMM17947.1 EAL domain-containing protein [Cellulomonas sp.]NMM30037.1 EAL domain-containing protein [Cellulomonas sp.]